MQLCSGSDVKPRRRRKEASNSGFRKRKLSDEQVNTLELNFGNEHKLISERKDRLAAELGLDPRQVAVWFQNRRARWRSKKLEEEYSKLKCEHESTIIQKCQLETEVSYPLRSFSLPSSWRSVFRLRIRYTRFNLTDKTTEAFVSEIGVYVSYEDDSCILLPLFGNI